MASLTALFEQLEVHSSNESHEEVLKTGQEILNKDGANVNAIKLVLVALINLDRYSQAYQIIRKHEAAIEANLEVLKLELAYVYYKVNRSEELRRLVTVVSIDEPLNHVLAQHYYKNGESEKALKIYQELISAYTKFSINDINDLSVNERAVISQLKLSNNFNDIKPTSESRGSFDALFNDSLLSIIDGKYTHALQLLEQSHQLILDSELVEQEKNNEVIPVKIQIAYVKYLQNETDEAMNILNSLPSELDHVLDLIVSNNKLSMINNLHSFEPMLLYRELGFPVSISKALSSLTYPQETILRRNEFFLAFLSQKSISSKKYDTKFPQSKLPHGLESVQDLTPSKLNSKKVLKLSLKNPNNISLALISSQISISSGNISNAALALESLIKHDPTVLLLPSIGKLLFVIYETLEQKKKISNLLLQIYDVLAENNEVNSSSLEKYYIFISLKLVSIDESKSQHLLKLINKEDIMNVQLDSEDVSALTKGIDVGKLIADGITPLLKVQPAASKVAKKRVTKKKKNKAPKVLDGKIDEERWLPLKDRSYYKTKKGRKDTQGGF